MFFAGGGRMSEYQGQTEFEREVLRRLEELGGALNQQRAELNAIRVVLTGDRAQHYELKQQHYELKQQVDELERKAG